MNTEKESAFRILSPKTGDDPAEKTVPCWHFVSLIRAFGPWSNLYAVPAFGDKEQIMGKINERCAEIDVGKVFADSTVGKSSA
jgi:hypothetical protein